MLFIYFCFILISRNIRQRLEEIIEFGFGINAVAVTVADGVGDGDGVVYLYLINNIIKWDVVF